MKSTMHKESNMKLVVAPLWKIVILDTNTHTQTYTKYNDAWTFITKKKIASDIKIQGSHTSRNETDQTGWSIDARKQGNEFLTKHTLYSGPSSI